ncbi:unnamed protein product [Soboliphyme baturini]|uniref:Malic_M domain-containing protein n=1 Tax=Soboliphyme baturini TaxID=241478 RepID=A0A183J7A1_9BILA|nr:unnamed protein product [Soboliphyme baturini]
MAMQQLGLNSEEAKTRIWMMDSKGLIVQSRKNLTPQKAEFAQDHKHIQQLKDVIEDIKPTALIGMSGNDRWRF